MTKSYEKFEKMFKKGDDIYFKTWTEIDKILNNENKENYIFNVINENTIKITLDSSNKRSVTVKGFFLFRLVEHKDVYDLFLDLDYKKSVKTKLDEINKLMSNGEKKVWGFQLPENKKDWAISWYKKVMDSKGIHKMIFHFILPLISEMKYKAYLHFSHEEKGLYMTDYFIITKLS
jgi:hypothetical protein